MRSKRDYQGVLDFQASHLKITNEYYARYEAISGILDETPRVLELAHRDLKEELERQAGANGSRRRCEFTSDTVLRTLIAQIIESESLRGIVVRIDDSIFLRRFVRVYDGPMMDFTTLGRLKNMIKPQTWKRINEALARGAVRNGEIEGDRLRLDTTAFETNIRWPSDSGLLWDTYRVLGRLIANARLIDPLITDGKRLALRKVKKYHTGIHRAARRKNIERIALKQAYSAMIAKVEDALSMASTVAKRLLRSHRSVDVAQWLAEDLEHYRALGVRVVGQARRRVLQGETVPNDEKIFSIFEPHTELLKRGKAGKPIEFGHMILLQQVEGCFITGYETFARKPVEHGLVDTVLKDHQKLFGELPSELSADKGFYESTKKLRDLEREIDVVSIGKKGKRTADEAEREASAEFKLAQRFRAGIEGSISVLKRALRMFRCFNRGFDRFTATVGATILAHNLLVLARGGG